MFIFVHRRWSISILRAEKGDSSSFSQFSFSSFITIFFFNLKRHVVASRSLPQKNKNTKQTNQSNETNNTNQTKYRLHYFEFSQKKKKNPLRQNEHNYKFCTTGSYHWLKCTNFVGKIEQRIDCGGCAPCNVCLCVYDSSLATYRPTHTYTLTRARARSSARKTLAVSQSSQSHTRRVNETK